MKKNKLSFFQRLTGASNPSDFDEKMPDELVVGDKKEGWIEEENSEGELPVDMYQTTDAIIIKTMVAGVKPEDLAITITREMVTIRGNRKETHESHGDDFFHKELYWGSFSRTIILPVEVEPEDAEAIEKHGLLTLKLPKINKEKMANLRVKSI
ncbi:MAG: Hsp20/alpha crystallin family protein [Patescibacteria group bacterium]